MNDTLYTTLVSGNLDMNQYAAEIQLALNKCAEAGFICTTPGNLNTFALIVGGIGILIGILACLGFQYSYRKMKERQEKEENLP
jgi:hypothetical protein